MHFLNPAWFFAAAALVIPVLIHLWNIKPGKVLKVGSTSLITAASRKSSRSFKLLDIPLFIVRCLLLLLLALLLAYPILQQRLKVIKAKGWVLIPKEDFSAGYGRYKTGIDSLLKLGYQFHYFNEGLPKADVKKLLAETKDIKSLDSNVTQPSSYWALLKQIDKEVVADMPVYLYTPNTINHFTGDRPQANLNLHWQTFTFKDSASTWVQDAWFTNNKIVRVIKGSSSPKGTIYKYANVQSDKSDQQFNVTISNGRPTVGLANCKVIPVFIDTTTLKIAVYTDHNQADAGYVKAALNAASQFSQRKTVIKQYTNAGQIPNNQTWIFWLSEQAVPAKLLLQPVKIFAYQSGRQTAITSWINTNGQYSVPSGVMQVPLFRITNSPVGQQNVIWHDGFGNAVLAASHQNKAEVYHFYSRFNPTWNDLVWDSSFPRMMLELISTKSTDSADVHDRRTLSSEQMQPVKTNDEHVLADKFTAIKDLTRYFWLALIIIFFMERWIATRNRLKQNNG